LQQKDILHLKNKVFVRTSILYSNYGNSHSIYRINW